ncbi:DUF1800 domain-containing protein [Wenjunlia tyrosinilytica]|uniref:DUF1800 domain-containing protein n=1 Tax=Wenjunlia tyrosinilytica TaxID=1544741 RepID=UPI001E4F1666|nr:DUF1800 domain-containing protein [Wenjunlia tyrosinilytica]
MAHLIRRSGFGATPEEIDAAAERGYADAVADLLGAPDTCEGLGQGPRPPHFDHRPLSVDPDLVVRRKATDEAAEQGRQLAGWWLERMVRASPALVEKRTFFWHSHFATSIHKVGSAHLMLRQNIALRRLGSGDFGKLAAAMVTDPAMIVWLDAEAATKDAPNENLAREVMELFTIGLGGYAEADVHEAARALTGLRVDQSTGRYVFEPSAHDPGTKEVFGLRGSFGAGDLVALLVDRPASHRFVVTRLWNRFAAPGPPPPDVLGRLLDAYGPGRNIHAVLRALFLDPAFTGPHARGALVKQPVEYVVGVLRALGIGVGSDAGEERTAVLVTLSRLGQAPFAPPHVGGWPQGRAWLTTATAQARLDFAQWAAARADIRPIASRTARSRPDHVARMLGVADGWTARTRTALERVVRDPRSLLTAALVSPEYLVN